MASILVALATLGAACSIPHPHVPEQRLTIPPLPQTSLMFDSAGHMITPLRSGEDRTLISLAEVPQVTQDAVVAAEDERFWRHHGVDAKAILRAALANAAEGSIVQGGSTITQQLIKNATGETDQTLIRKVREAEAAWNLEDRYTKEQILELYLNTVYFGQGAYGIQAAAKTYFSIPAKKLDLGQSAMLAALISSPSAYDPVFHPKLARERRDLVLGRMLELGMIDQVDYLKAQREGLGLDVAEDQSRYAAPYFVDYVKRWFLSNDLFGATYEERYDLLFHGGLRIYTTVDMKLQRYAEEAVDSILTYKSDPYGAMTVIDPATGAVRAMVGGRDFFSKRDRFAQLNLATGGATGRSAGSAFKPFALVSALTRAISPLQRYPAPGHINIRLPAGYVPPVWPVDNYDGEGGGVETLEQATINSVNTVYAQVIMQVGPQAVVDVAHSMGIRRHLDAVPSAVLGTNEVDTLEMASAYGTLAAMGNHTPPMVVTKVATARGDVLYEAEPELNQVINPGVAWTTTQILQKVVQVGTGSQANIGRPAAGKTGTAQRWTDAWFVGYTPQLVAAVWVGFPQGSVSMTAPRVRIPHVLGGTWPAEIWHAFMTNALRDLPAESFKRPKFQFVTVRIDVKRGCLANQWTLPTDIQWITYYGGTQPYAYCVEPRGPQVIPVPNVVGMNELKAGDLLKSYGFLVYVTIVDSEEPAGVVLSQLPGSDQLSLQGTIVHLEVSSGTPVEPSPLPSESPSPSPEPTPSPSPSPTPTPTPSPTPS